MSWVRYLVDDVAQVDRAEAVLRGNVMMPTAVFLETERVLHPSYRFDRAAIAEAVHKLLP